MTPRPVAFCAWGDGPDVGINTADGHALADLTGDDAIALGWELLTAGLEAKRLDQVAQQDLYPQRNAGPVEY